MEHHGYCRGLRETAERMGCAVIEHRMIDHPFNPLNPTAVMVIKKGTEESSGLLPAFHCPSCRQPLTSVRGVYYCAAEGLAYPVLDDIPCLARHNAILASHFLDDRIDPSGEQEAPVAVGAF
jgi:uncharacterized protein YbaR (Trm112 family)